MKKQLVTLACSLALLAFTQQAQAHAHLKSSQPADKSELATSPKTITLNFTEGLEPAFSDATLKDSQGAVVPTGKATVTKKGGEQMVIPLTAPLPSGAYQVDWHVLSVDGHKTKGNYRFTMK